MQHFATLVCLIYKSNFYAKHEPMKRCLILLFFMVGWCGFLGANTPQQPNPTNYEEQTFWERFTNWNVPNLQTRNEVRMGAAMPEYDFVNNLHNNYLGGGLKDAYTTSYQQAGGLYTYSSPHLNFMVRWGQRWEYGVGTLYSQVRQNLYNTVTGEVSKRHRSDILLLAPTIRWNIIRWNWFRFYLQMGMNYFFVGGGNSDSNFYSEPFFGYGYTIGKKIFFFSEGNFGEHYIGSMGIGYRF